MTKINITTILLLLIIVILVFPGVVDLLLGLLYMYIFIVASVLLSYPIYLWVIKGTSLENKD